MFAPDHNLRQRKPVPPSTASASGTSLPPVESATAEPANLLVKTPTPSTSAQALSSGVAQLSSPKLLLRHRSVSPAVLSRNSSLSRSVCSVSPSSDSSSCSTSTLVQDSESIHHGSTKCCTFNCRGWKNGKLSLQNYINSLDFCFIQEHWLFDDHFNDVREISDFLSVGVSGMNSDMLRCGRPYGGCSILY